VKIILSSRKNHYMRRLSTFLIAAALIGGMVSCAPPIVNEFVHYNLAISNTTGGSVTAPGEGVFTYDEATLVSLVASPASGYRFVNWTGDVDTIANVNAASTTITMNDNYSITANFIAQYELTIGSTDSGEVTTPGEGVFTYGAGTVVDLVAEAEEGYRFVSWTGDVGTIANVKFASTTITMNGEYTVTASFARAIDYSIFGKLTKIEADPQNGFYWAYYLFIPNSVRSLVEENQTVYLLVEPNNTGYPHDDQEVHDSAAMTLANRRASFAAQLRVPLLIPTFPRPQPSTAPLYMQALDRNTMLSTIDEWERIDLQLTAMVDDATVRLSEKGISLHSKILMMGYSASGMFVNRFVVMHPDRIQAAAVGSPGGWPIAPLEQWEGISLRYPVGVDDIEDLTGEEFDIEEFRTVPLYFYLGDVDTNDSVPGPTGWSPANKQLIFEHFGETPIKRWPIAEQMYDSARCNSQFVLYPGVGHELTYAMLTDVRNFFLNNMEPR